MRIVVTGLIGQYAFGGVTWDYIQYVLGFKALGHDVWYLEDSANWPYDPVKQEPGADCSHNVAYLKRIMQQFDMGDRWIYRNEPDDSYHGVRGEAEAEKILQSADVLVNVSGACWLRPLTASVKNKLFLDGDPMFTQTKLNASKPDYLERVLAHNQHFSFGLGIGRPDCHVPTAGLTWKPTVQPIALDLWKPGVPSDPSSVAHGAWTTVMNWASYKPEEFAGETYGQKDLEFLRFQELPTQTPERFVLAMGQGPGKNRPTEKLQSLGWTIIEPDEHLPDHTTYHHFINQSQAEWSIAKNGYVKSRSGWFSCRSACYLAAGKPVVVQDTGWSDHLPSGDGAIAFSTMDEAVQAIHKVSTNYAHHAQAARAYAEKYFDAATVCAQLLQ